jgi:hypothetical protein
VLSTISTDELGRIWARGNCIEARFVLPGHDWPLPGLHDLALKATYSSSRSCFKLGRIKGQT